MKINSIDAKIMSAQNVGFIEHTDEVSTHETLWGVAETDPNFSKTIPHSVIGKPTAINQFYAMITDTANQDAAGWPNFLENVEFSDATKLLCKWLTNQKFVPLKTPPGSISRPYPGFTLDNQKVCPISVPMFNKHINTNTMNLEVMRETPTGSKNVKTTVTKTTNTGNEIFQYTDLIEKSQYCNHIHGDGPEPDAQPWIHVGIMPSKAASVQEIVTPSDKHTDVQAYFEVMCKMDCMYTFPNMYTHAQVYNVPCQDQLVRLDPVHTLSIKKTPFWGLYRKG